MGNKLFFVCGKKWFSMIEQQWLVTQSLSQIKSIVTPESTQSPSLYAQFIVFYLFEIDKTEISSIGLYSVTHNKRKT